MTNLLEPPYRSSFVPECVDVTPYHLKNESNTRNIHCPIRFFSKSFLHNTISEWNQLPEGIYEYLQYPRFFYYICLGILNLLPFLLKRIFKFKRFIFAACTWRPSATTLKGYQVLEHGVWKDMPCAIGTVFIPKTCNCGWATNAYSGA
jgi:hypothetical protein